MKISESCTLLNAPSLLKYKDEIDILLNENHIDILALNETRLAPFVSDSHIMINNYSKPARCDRNRQGGGVAVYVKDTISYKTRNDLPTSGLEIVCIEVMPKCSSSFIVLAWYRPPNRSIIRFLSLSKSFKYLNQKTRKLYY